MELDGLMPAQFIIWFVAAGLFAPNRKPAKPNNEWRANQTKEGKTIYSVVENWLICFNPGLYLIDF